MTQIIPETAPRNKAAISNISGPPAQGTGDTSAQDRLYESARKRLNLRTVEELARVVNERKRQKKNAIIDGFIPPQSLVLVGGDSGLGKSALLYTMGMAAATGTDFLGFKTRPVRVLMMDFENGIEQSLDIAQKIVGHMGLAEMPRDFIIWNFNDSADSYGEPGNQWSNIIKESGCELAIIDPIGMLFPEIEETKHATSHIKRLRKLMREAQTSIIFSHHVKKPSEVRGDFEPPSLEDDSNREWFLQIRGARALVNGVDVRAGADLPRKRINGRTIDADLVLGGFARVTGNLPLLYLKRETNEEGVPIGYQTLSGADYLSNTEHRTAFDKFPSDRGFTFKEAKTIFGKGSSATTELLKKCQAFGLISHDAKLYQKTQQKK